MDKKFIDIIMKRDFFLMIFRVFREFDVSFRKSLIFLFFLMVFNGFAFAAKGAVLDLCAFYEGKEFQLYAANAAEAGKLGFVEMSKSKGYFRKMKVLLDGEQHDFFKPLKKGTNCLRIDKIPAGRHTVSLEFKSVDYTALEVAAPHVAKFKDDLLYNGNVKVVKGNTAKIEMQKSDDTISLYQGITNEPVADCTDGCEIPAGLPVYFKGVINTETGICPLKFRIVFENEREKQLGCYNVGAIKNTLENYIKENHIACDPESEYAYFRVFGEGCLISFESDPQTGGVLPPQIVPLPPEQRSTRYYVGSSKKERRIYTFNKEKVGSEIIPEKGEILQFIEETSK